MHRVTAALLLLATACSSSAGYTTTEELCIGAAMCAGDKTGSTVQSCVDSYREDAGKPGSFTDCCQACASDDGGARLACEAHCGGYQECCPR